jgi:DNA-directed RNA polymerase specialized sigma24 family protein
MTRKPPSLEAFEKMLAWLDSDREQAGKKYQKIHSRLMIIFAAHGCSDPEGRADETMDRVIAKMDWLQENYEGEPFKYFCGVARYVIKEDVRNRVPPRAPIEHDHSFDENDRNKYDCLDRCMSELPARNQSLVLEYYEGQGREKILRRKKLAEEHAISLTALRLRVFHLREQLSKCLKDCLERQAR